MVTYATPVFGFDPPGALIGAVAGGLAGLAVWGIGRLLRFLGGRMGWDRRPPPPAEGLAEYEPLAPVPDLGDRHGGKAVASLVLGCVGLLASCLPILGLPVTITGLVLGLKGLRSRHHALAVAGVTLSVLGLVLSAANAGLGAYLAATGRHPLVR